MKRIIQGIVSLYKGSKFDVLINKNKKFKEISFWVIYTPVKYQSSILENFESYLDDDGYWTKDITEAKRYSEYQRTVNMYTRSKEVSIRI